MQFVQSKAVGRQGEPQLLELAHEALYRARLVALLAPATAVATPPAILAKDCGTRCSVRPASGGGAAEGPGGRAPRLPAWRCLRMLNAASQSR